MYKKILVAVDSSRTSAKALAEAIALAKNLGSQLCILHADDESGLAQHGMGLGSYVDVNAAKADIRSIAQKLLDAAVEHAAAAGVKADTLLLEADNKRVAELIVAGAAQWGADLIVTGTHGRRGFARLLVGSVAENLVRIATTSLMLVREEEA